MHERVTAPEAQARFVVDRASRPAILAGALITGGTIAVIGA